MLDKMKQLMEMKKQADRIKKELEASKVEITDVRGIKIVIDGAQSFKSIEIDSSLLENKGKLESDVLRSINLAIRKSQEIAAQKMRSALPAGFPGL